MTRIALCIKDRLSLDAYSAVLDRCRSLRVVAREMNVSDFISSAKNNKAHVLVVDSEQLDDDELQFLLGAQAAGDFLLAMIGDKNCGATADAVILRSSTGVEFVEALSSLVVAEGELGNGKRLYGMANEFTQRESEVAELIAKGFSNRTIAEVTALHSQSVKNLVSVIIRKLKCENRTQVALKLMHSDGGFPSE